MEQAVKEQAGRAGPARGDPRGRDRRRDDTPTGRRPSCRRTSATRSAGARSRTPATSSSPTRFNPILREVFDRSRAARARAGVAERARDERGVVGHRPRRARDADRSIPRRDGGELRGDRRAAAAGGARASASTSSSGQTWRRSSARRRWTPCFPAERLLATFEETLAGLGLHNGAPGNVIVDAEPRPNKSPRAFCAPVRVPEEVYLVLTRIGGREDYETLMHEAGHAEHFSHVDPDAAGRAPLPRRQLGDRGLRLPVPAPDARTPRGSSAGSASPIPSRSSSRRARRSSSTCGATARSSAYELELQGEGDVDGLDELYARRLSEAVHVDWPRANWLNDVDPFFYCAAYLRAWALETHLRRELQERFGELWFEDPGAGELLRELWSAGQREPARRAARGASPAPS